MEVAKDTGKQEKRRMAVRGAGKGVEGMVVWGGVAVVAASILLASVSAFKSWRKNKVATREADDLIKVNGEADTPSTEYDTQPLEIIGKMREDKLDYDNEAPNRDEEKNADEVTNGTITQKHQLANNQINDKEIVVKKELIIAIPKPTSVESDSVQGNDFGENVVTKDEELAEEIEVDTPMSNGHEDESDENSSYEEIAEKQQEHDGKIEVVEREYVHDEEKAKTAEKNTYLQQRQQEERDGEENLERKEQVVENKSVHEEVDEECEGKVILIKEEESSETNEEDESKENSEGTSDSSIEFNDDKVWPAEAMEDILMEIKKSETDNQIREEKTDENVKVEKDQKSLKNNNNYATDHCEIEDFGESVSYRKRYMKDLLLHLSSMRILIWTIAVLGLAVAAPLVLSPEGILKLSLFTFFVVSVSRVLKTII